MSVADGLLMHGDGHGLLGGLDGDREASGRLSETCGEGSCLVEVLSSLSEARAHRLFVNVASCPRRQAGEEGTLAGHLVLGKIKTYGVILRRTRTRETQHVGPGQFWMQT